MRLFIGIPAPLKLKNEVGDLLKEKPFKASWVKAENLHITLKFLGEVEEKKSNELIKDFNQILKPMKIKELPFECASSFPNEKRPRVLFLKFKEDEEISNYQKNIEEIFSKIGFKKEEREFKMHLTIARFKSPPELLKFKDFVDKTSKISFSPFVVEEIVLFESILRQGGPIYTPLEKIKCLT